MTYLHKTLLWIGLVLVCGIGHAEPQCENFLRAMKKQPLHLDFVKCEQIREAQIEKLQATYRVRGAYAGPIERFFVQTANMPALRFICCVWEPWPTHLKLSRRGSYKNPRGYDYEVTMFTDETLIDSRAKWPEIYYFWVTIALPLDSP